MSMQNLLLLAGLEALGVCPCRILLLLEELKALGVCPCRILFLLAGLEALGACPCRILFPSPPLVLPQGGVGDRHLVNPKRAKPPPKGAVQSILWKVVSMFRNSRSNVAGGRNSTPSESRSKFHCSGSSLSARMISYCCSTCFHLSP